MLSLLPYHVLILCFSEPSILPIMGLKNSLFDGERNLYFPVQLQGEEKRAGISASMLVWAFSGLSGL